MKYLKLIHSFDEFASDAKAGCVYYQDSESVYYWLSLATIWGYIGYNKETRTFTYNGKEWSILPSVPDPENLDGSIVINNASFNTTPNTITIQHSDFNLIPLKNISFKGSPTKVLIKCGNSNLHTNLYFEGYQYDNLAQSVTVEYEDYDLHNLDSLTCRLNYNVDYLGLAINDTNNKFDFATTTINWYSYYSYPRFNFLCNKDKNYYKEEDYFENTEDLFSYNPSIYNYFRPLLPDDSVNTINLKTFLYNNEVKCWAPFSSHQNLPEIVIDGSLSNGVITDVRTSLGMMNSGGWYASNWSYVNVSDFNGLYKPKMQTDTYQIVTSELLNYCKSKYLDLFRGNKVTNINDWFNVMSREIDLNGVKYFSYYIDGYPNASATYINPASYQDFLNYINPNGATCTPKLKNVNLEEFHCPSKYIFINTEDSDVYLGNVKNRLMIYLNNVKVHISSCDSNITILSKKDNLTNEPLYLESFHSDNVVDIDFSDYGTQRTYPIVNVESITGIENPTALDYYNTNFSMYHILNKATIMSHVDYVIVHYGQKLNSYYTRYIDVNRLKCIDNGGDFSTNGSLKTASDMASLVAAIPNRIPTGSNPVFDFTQSQYNLLTPEQEAYILGLGYAITIKV